MLGNGLTIHRGRFEASDNQSQAELSRLIADAVARPFDPTSGTTNFAVIRRRYRSALIVTALPLSPHLSEVFARGKAILMFHDPDRRKEVRTTLLVKIFGLTPAEASLASKLSFGANLNSTADQLGISIETARTQLKGIFAKTGVNRQADLLTMLQSLPEV